MYNRIYSNFFLTHIFGCFLLQTFSNNAALNDNSISINVNSPKAVQAAEFAVNELCKLSDSNIYETIKLSKILSAQEQDGKLFMLLIYMLLNVIKNIN